MSVQEQNLPTTRGLVNVVRRELAEARAAARTGLTAALAARQAAMAQLDSVRKTAPGRRGSLADTRDEACAAAQARWERETTSLTSALREHAEAAAPGFAGSPFSVWRSCEKSTADAGNTLLRIGTALDGLPALVPLLDAAHLRLTGADGNVDGLIGGLLLRALSCAPPGALRITVYDPGQLGGALAGLAPLAPAGLVSYLGPGGLSPLLDELVEHIRRINESVLAGSYPDLAELARRTGRRPEPWRIAVLLADTATELTAAQQAQLDRVVRTGIASGVHVISRGLELPSSYVETIEVARDGKAQSSLTGELWLKLDSPPSPPLVTSVCKSLAEQVIAGPPPVPFAALMPDQLWSFSSADALRAPVGEGTDGRLVELVLGDDPPHALIGGPSGSGKTNLIYAWLAALATRYSTSELELHLLDFKEGVSFARFAPGTRDPSWLPQVKLVGININSDREFGLALLRHLSEELKRRAVAAKKRDASKLSELRKEDPDGHWPRIVAVIDEFQVLLGARDAVTSEAVSLLEDLARRGRSQGIHLVLASQDVAGIEALWGKSGLVAQFTLRIALPKARRVLAETNLAAELIPRCHAVVNADSGVPSANTVVRLPDAGDRETWMSLQEQLWQNRPATCEPPRLFDGDVPPLFPLLPPTPAPETLARLGAVALLGETIDVAGRPATLRLNRAPGRNLAVLGTRAEEACAILVSAGLTLGRQHAPGTVRFSVACLDDDATPAAKSLHKALPGSGLYGPSDVLELLENWQSDKPHYVFGFAIDAAASVLSGRGHELLRTMLNKGPESRTHLMGWWRTVARLRDDLGGIGARFDAIGAWVALDVHGAELNSLYPQPGGPVWHPRAQRALFFDRSVHQRPEILIPYEVVA